MIERSTLMQIVFITLLSTAPFISPLNVFSKLEILYTFNDRLEKFIFLNAYPYHLPLSNYWLLLVYTFSINSKLICIYIDRYINIYIYLRNSRRTRPTEISHLRRRSVKKFLWIILFLTEYPVSTMAMVGGSFFFVTLLLILGLNFCRGSF